MLPRILQENLTWGKSVYLLPTGNDIRIVRELLGHAYVVDDSRLHVFAANRWLSPLGSPPLGEAPQTSRSCSFASSLELTLTVAE
jgi:hypothetical protein